MGRYRLKRRHHQIKVKQKRKLKLAKLRQLYVEAEDEAGRKKVIEKLGKVAPWLTKEEFLAPEKKKKA